MLCCDRTSVYLCAFSLQNLAELQDFFIPLSVSLWNNLGDPVFDGVGLAGIKSRTNAFLVGPMIMSYLVVPFLSPTVFPFSSFIRWVGIVGLGSSD